MKNLCTVLVVSLIALFAPIAKSKDLCATLGDHRIVVSESYVLKPLELEGQDVWGKGFIQQEITCSSRLKQLVIAFVLPEMGSGGGGFFKAVNKADGVIVFVEPMVDGAAALQHTFSLLVDPSNKVGRGQDYYDSNIELNAFSRNYTKGVFSVEDFYWKGTEGNVELFITCPKGKYGVAVCKGHFNMARNSYRYNIVFPRGALHQWRSISEHVEGFLTAIIQG